MLSYLSALRSYAVFHSRARRRQFWMFTLVNIIISVALQVLLKSPVPYTVYSIAVFLPTLAVAVRRLHDIDRSAWWLLFGLVPIIGQIVLIVFFVSRGHEGANRFGPAVAR